MLAASELTAGYHEGPLFTDVSFVVNPGDRIGIVGANGVGKSTLLRLLGGQVRPDLGSVTTDATVSLLEQVPDFETPVRVYMDRMSGGLLTMQDKLYGLFEQMGDSAEAATQVSAVQTEFEARSGWGIDNKIAELMSRLDAPADAINRRFGELSGGQQARVMLAGQLLQEPGTLLLDEPTNNLDEAGLTWLEDYLDKYTGGVVIVSHDRTFLDNTISKIIELDGSGGPAEFFEGNYTDYRDEAARRLARQALDYVAQQKRDARLGTAIQALRAKGERYQDLSTSDFYRAKARRIDATRKALEHRRHRLQQRDNHIAEPEAVRRLPLRLQAQSRAGRLLVRAAGLTVGYDPEVAVLRDVSWRVHGRDRVAITGENGSGKTTLLNALAGDTTIVQAGTARLFAQKSAYLTQTTAQRNARQSPLTALEWFRRSVGEIYEPDAVSLLAWFGFDRGQVRQQIRTFSPGEVVKLSLLAIAYSGAELLLLDEPTNHLDINALDVVEHVFADFDGTLLVASHDRSFIGNIGCSRMLRVGGQRVQEVAV